MFFFIVFVFPSTAFQLHSFFFSRSDVQNKQFLSLCGKKQAMERGVVVMCVVSEWCCVAEILDIES